MYKAISSEEYTRNITKRAQEAFKDHILHKIQHGKWIIRNPKNSSYWVEIMILSTNKIIILGDMNPLIIAVSRDKQDPKAIINWAANSHISYFQEKAAIGMGNIGTTVTDIEVALHQLNELLEVVPQKNIQNIKDAIDDLNNDDCSIENIKNDLYNLYIDPELIYDIGIVISPRVIYAHEAMKKLASLIS